MIWFRMNRPLPIDVLKTKLFDNFATIIFDWRNNKNTIFYSIFNIMLKKWKLIGIPSFLMSERMSKERKSAKTTYE